MDGQRYKVQYRNLLKIKWSKIQIFLKTGFKYRYELMYAVDVYSKEYVTMYDDTISGGGIKMQGTSSKESLISLVQKINFIDNWLQ